MIYKLNAMVFCSANQAVYDYLKLFNG